MDHSQDLPDKLPGPSRIVAQNRRQSETMPVRSAFPAGHSANKEINKRPTSGQQAANKRARQRSQQPNKNAVVPANPCRVQTPEAAQKAPKTAKGQISPTTRAMKDRPDKGQTRRAGPKTE